MKLAFLPILMTTMLLWRNILVILNISHVMTGIRIHVVAILILMEGVLNVFCFLYITMMVFHCVMIAQILLMMWSHVGIVFMIKIK